MIVFYNVMMPHRRAPPYAISLITPYLSFPGMWKAARELFPTATLHGCNFHWVQAVYRKIKKMGLTDNYNTDDRCNSLCRLIMALPMLPAEHITAAFDRLYPTLRTLDPRLHRLADYIRKTWITTSVFPPHTWSVYKRAIRTNNDVEGWHNRLNSRHRQSSPPFYQLVERLHSEAKLASIQCLLLDNGRLRRRQHDKYKNRHRLLFAAWDAYDSRDLTTFQLLKRCSHLTWTRPIPHTTEADTDEDDN